MCLQHGGIRALAGDKSESAVQKSMVPYSIVLAGGIRGLPGVSGEPTTEEYSVLGGGIVWSGMVG